MADGQPISRQEICNAAVQNKVYNGASIPNFVGGEIVDGKRYDNSKIKSRLQWTPKFATFSSFMAEDYTKEMTVPLLSTKLVSSV